MERGGALHIHDPEAARVLTEPGERRFLEPFVGTELSLSEAAEQLGVKLNTLLYRVRKLIGLGLVEIVREERRAGRATKIYRAAAESFFAPFEITPYASLEAVLHEMLGPSDRVFIRNLARTLFQEAPRYGVYVTKERTGGLLVRLAPTDSGEQARQAKAFFHAEFPAVWTSTAVLELDFARAKALQRELYELLQRYATEREAGQQRYLLRLGLTPLHDEPLWE